VSDYLVKQQNGDDVEYEVHDYLTFYLGDELGGMASGCPAKHVPMYPNKTVNLGPSHPCMYLP